MTQTDFIIIGGRAIGPCVAYHLLKEGFEGEILIFEKDSLYEYSSTPRSAGGIRQLFTTAINIQISRYSLQKYLTFPEDMAVNGEPAEIDFRQHGYFFLAQDENWAELKAQAELQRNYGVPSELLTPDELQNVIPELTTDDLVGGLYCAEDGYLDPYSVMQGYAKNAKQLGATFVNEQVERITHESGVVTGIETKDGNRYQAPQVINCAGGWAAQISENSGFPIPVIPLKRQIIQFDIEEPLAKQLPLTVDPSGVYFRHEGQYFISGFSEKVTPGFDFSWKRSFFMEQLWPILGHRVKNFEHAKIISGWAGLYAHNTEDQNAIVGEHPEAKGYYMACGFSGHGMQQAPAVGQCLAELIHYGQYETLDLRPLRFERFKENDLLIEGAIV